MVSGIGGVGGNEYVASTSGAGGVTTVEHVQKKTVDEIMDDFKSGKIKLAEALQYLSELGAASIKISVLANGVKQVSFEIDGKNYSMSTNAECAGQTGGTTGGAGSAEVGEGRRGTRGLHVSTAPSKCEENTSGTFEDSETIITGLYNSEDEAVNSFNDWLDNGGLKDYILESLAKSLGISLEDVKNFDITSNIDYDIPSFKLCKDGDKFYLMVNIKLKCNYNLTTERDWQAGDIRRDDDGYVWEYQEDGSWKDVTEKSEKSTSEVQSELNNLINSLKSEKSKMSSASASEILKKMENFDKQYSQYKEKLLSNFDLYENASKLSEELETSYKEYSTNARKSIMEKIKQGKITEEEYQKCISALGELEPLKKADFSEDITNFMSDINSMNLKNIDKETFDKLFDAYMAGKNISITDAAQMKNELFESIKNGKIDKNACENIKENAQKSEELDSFKENLLKDLNDFMASIKDCVNRKDINGLKQILAKLPNLLTNLQLFANSANEIETKYGDSLLEMQEEINEALDKFFEEIENGKKLVTNTEEAEMIDVVKNQAKNILGGISLSMSEVFSVADTLFANNDNISVDDFVKELEKRYGKKGIVNIDDEMEKIQKNNQYTKEDKEKLLSLFTELKSKYGKNVSLDVVETELKGTSNKITNLVGNDILKQFNVDGKKIDQTAITNAIVNHASEIGVDINTIKISANELIDELKARFGVRKDITKEEFEDAIKDIYTKKLNEKAIKSTINENSLAEYLGNQKGQKTSADDTAKSLANNICNEKMTGMLSNCKDSAIVNKFVEMLGTLGKIMQNINNPFALDSLIAELKNQIDELTQLLNNEAVREYDNKNKTKTNDDEFGVNYDELISNLKNANKALDTLKKS